ncbi:hypothetical protein [Herbaspirillum chlorophenolicum]|uniref:hypothetical protein n=1 Tax=Herbaspirillum chlorophenolicum TaxID=211589 RepID=UPI000A8CA5B1|nr:hypothetical protein [Herbaspirillum chlorophenolicum]
MSPHTAKIDAQARHPGLVARKLVDQGIAPTNTKKKTSASRTRPTPIPLKAGALTGALFGGAVGEAIDNNALNNHGCQDCGHTFNKP